MLSGFLEESEESKNQRIKRDENKKKFNALPQEEKDKINKMHKEWRKWLIWFFGFFLLIMLFPLIITSCEKRDCIEYEPNFLTHIKNIYPSFEPTWYGVRYSKGVCVWYAHWLTERWYTKDEHLYIIRDILWWKDIYMCWDRNQNCSDFDFLTKLKKYDIE